MLLNLHVKNLALIEHLDVNFGDHLNILTGETGAGKSMLIQAVTIALGGRCNKDFVRQGAEYGMVELLFYIDNDHTKAALEELEIAPSEEGELLISRRIYDNRVVNKINDQTVTAAKLKEAAEVLLDLHAQNEQQSLKQKGYQREILDQYGHERIMPVKKQLQEAYKAYKEAKEALESQELSEAEQKRTMDLLQYELEEIHGVNPIVGEDEQLAKQYKKMKNGKDILRDIEEAHAICGYEESHTAGSLIGRAMSAVTRAASMDEELEGLASQITDIDALLSDLNRELADYIDSVQFDEESFYEVEQRLDVINGLKVKYGNSIEAILEYADQIETQYHQLEHYAEYMEELRASLEASQKQYEKLANELHKLREEYGNSLQQAIHDALVDLNFLDVDFEICVKGMKEYTSHGSDEIYFMISTNVGEDKRLLSEVASGGELSRVMLAIKSVLADVDHTDTLIFDEIDVGISGRTAQKVSEKLCTIGKKHQVISITHLPQIAAMADTHFKIEKQVIDNKTITNIFPLSEEDSVLEIARLLGGVEITDTVLLSAKEMKDMAGQTKIY